MRGLADLVLVYRPPDGIEPTRSIVTTGTARVRRTVAELMFAWSVEAAGRLAWLATENGLDRFEEHLPAEWKGHARRARGSASEASRCRLVLINARS
jgi:hypothetical protein